MVALELARQQIRRLCAVRQRRQCLRFYCEGSTPAGEDEILGIYTPVTKRLWVERQQRAKLNLGVDSHLQEPVPVPPRPITITYPFSTSHTLREQVEPFHKYNFLGLHTAVAHDTKQWRIPIAFSKQGPWRFTTLKRPTCCCWILLIFGLVAACAAAFRQTF